MDKETLQYIANSDVWDKIKEFVILPEVEKASSVMTEIMVNGVPLTSADAYNAKKYTVQKLVEIVRSVDVFKAVKNTPAKEDFE